MKKGKKSEPEVIEDSQLDEASAGTLSSGTTSAQLDAYQANYNQAAATETTRNSLLKNIISGSGF
jgi:hypothetical protein